MSVQNEPLYEPANYPGMGMFPDQQGRFIAGSLAPALRSAGLDDTKILAYDHNWDVPDYPEAIYSQPAAASPITRHCNTATPVRDRAIDRPTTTIRMLRRSRPSARVAPGRATKAQAFAATMASVIDVPRNWGQSVILWNLALDGKHGPVHRWL